MTQKALSIRVNVSDKATARLKAIGKNLLNVGRNLARMAAGVTSSLGRIARSLTSVRGLIAGVVAVFAVRRLVSGVITTAEAFDELAKNAKRFDIPVDEFNRLNFIAGQSGASMEDMTKAIRTGQRNLVDFIDKGTGPAVDSLRRIGLSTADITDGNGKLLDATELLEVFADGIARTGDQATRVNVVQSIFGRSGTQLLPLLQLGSEGVAALSGELEALGVVEARQTAIAEAFVDSLGRVRQAWLVLKANVIERIGPTLTDINNRVAVGVAVLAESFDEVLELLASPFRSGRDAEVAQRKLADLIDQSVQLAVPVIGAGVLLLVDTIGAALTFGTRQLVPTLAPTLTKLFIDMFTGPLKFATNYLANQFAGTQFEKILRDYEANLIEGIAGADEAIDEFFLGQRTTPEGFDKRLKQVVDSIEDSRTPIKVAIASVTEAVGERLPGFVGALERAGGFVSEYRERWRKLRESLLAQQNAGTGEAGSSVSGSTLLDSFAEGATNAGRQVDTLGKIAERVGQTVTTSLAGGLTDAFVSVIDGTKNAQEAFRQFASDFLRQIGTMILRMLLLRTISSSIGGLGGGIPGVDVNTGGVIGRTGRVLRFNTGGIVPGANVNRDMIPAMLSPGEGVLNRQAVRRNPGLVARVNRGGDPGGGSLTINQTVNVSGNADKAAVRDMGKATAEAVLAALRSRPAFRQGMRAALA